MIHIYKKDNTNYDFNGDTILNPSEATLTMELNGLNCVEVKQEYESYERYKEIIGDRVVKIDAPNNQKMFYKITERDGDIDTEVYFNAKPLAEVDLKKSILLDCRPTNCTGQDFLNKVLEGTKFKGISNISKTTTSHLIRKSKYDSIFSDDENSFLSKLGGEVWFEGFNIHINESIGVNNNVIFEYGKDLIDLNENLIYEDVVTRIYPTGFDGITLVDNGYVDSPNISKYSEIKEAFINYDDVKLKQNENDEEGFATLEEAQAELIRRAREEFENGIDLPQMEMNIEVARLEDYLEYANFKDLVKVNLGDTVRVRHSILGIDIITRVIAIKYDLVNEKYTEITLSSQVSNYIKNQTSTNKKIESALNSDGSVVGGKIKGFIDGTKASLKASKEIAQMQEYRIAEVEDLDPNSPTYGSMVWGTGGLYLSKQRNAQNTGWDYATAITAEGTIADKIIGNFIADKTGNTTINMQTGEFKSKIADGSEIIISPEDGFYRKVGSSKNEYHNLTYSGQITFNWNDSIKYIQLPSEFKGKKFNILPFINRTGSNTSWEKMSGFFINYNIESYDNAIFSIYAGSTVWTEEPNKEVDSFKGNKTIVDYLVIA